MDNPSTISRIATAPSHAEHSPNRYRSAGLSLLRSECEKLRFVNATMPGYRPAVGTTVSPGLICPLCRLILRDAIQTAEGIRLCESCYEQSNWSNPQVVAVEANNLRKCNRDQAAQREVASLSIECDYAAAGCTWIGQVNELHQIQTTVDVIAQCFHWKYHFYYKHQLMRCQYLPVLCHNSNCGTTLPRCWLEKHETACPKRPVTCQYCGRGVQLCDLGRHWELCPYYSKRNTLLYSSRQNVENPFETHKIHPFRASYGPPTSSSYQTTPAVEASGLWLSPIQEQGCTFASGIVTVAQTVHQDVMMQQQYSYVYKSTATGVASTNT